MAIFTGGTIPTIQVSSNTLINNAVTGVAGNLADTTLSVALSPLLGAELSNQLGLDPNASFGNLGSVISNGVIGTGEQYLNQIIDQQIINSDALGPFGPLVGGLAQNATSVLTQGVSGLLSGQGLSGFGGLTDLFGGGGGTATTASAPNNVPSRAFPGAGDEPYGDTDADYQGSVYNMGTGGPDVTFSIKPAVTPAAAGGASEIANPLAEATAGLTESLNGAIGDFPASLGNIASSALGAVTGGGGLGAIAGSALGAVTGGGGLGAIAGSALGAVTGGGGIGGVASSLVGTSLTNSVVGGAMNAAISLL